MDLKIRVYDKDSILLKGNQYKNWKICQKPKIILISWVINFIFSGVNHAQGQGDPQYGAPQPGRYHPLTSSSGAGGRSPALSLVSGSGGRGSRRGSRRSPLNSPGTPLYQDNLGLSEPGVKPTQDNSDRWINTYNFLQWNP